MEKSVASELPMEVAIASVLSHRVFSTDCHIASSDDEGGCLMRQGEEQASYRAQRNTLSTRSVLSLWVEHTRTHHDTQNSGSNTPGLV